MIGGPEYRGEPESEEDYDRELDEILSELRVLLPGVAVIFGFLLTVPFTSRFPDLSASDRGAYLVGFVASALALVFLAGETAYHRLRGKPYDKRRLIRLASLEAVAGLACLGVALTAVVFLVSDAFFPGVATPVTVAVAGLAAGLWLVVPLADRCRKPPPSG